MYLSDPLACSEPNYLRSAHKIFHLLLEVNTLQLLAEIIGASWVEIQMGDLQDETDLATGEKRPRAGEPAEGKRARGRG